MELTRLEQVVQEEGELNLSGLPVRRGDRLQILIQSVRDSGLLADALLSSEMVGLWKDRQDIDGTRGFARALRDQAQNRE
ncbi:MAG: hypothetical protein KDK33_13610 [Leptospiraceae bacterium]|nr:hypothetical protein [Leptospiraceae bacterium]